MNLIVLKTFLIGLAGGWLFTLVHLPLSWLLGPMTAVFFMKSRLRQALQWPIVFQNIGLVVVGYTIGLSFSKETLAEMFRQLPAMLVVTIAVILFSALMALFTSKLTGVNFQSTLTGSIPGGLSQMVALGEELRGIDLTVVTIIQLARLLSVIFLVPFLVFSPWLNPAGYTPASAVADASPFSPAILIFLGFAWLCALAAQKGKCPTPYVLGPVIGISALSVNGLDVPSLPVSFYIIAQLFLGIYLGLMLKFENSKKTAAFTLLSILTSCLLVFFSFIIGVLLMRTHEMSLLTAFISTAPGGMAEMAIVGQAVHANLSIIVGYHLFRLLFILFLMPPFLKWLYRQRYFQKKEAS